jgi:ATP-dependent DNA helicase RecQ
MQREGVRPETVRVGGRFADSRTREAVVSASRRLGIATLHPEQEQAIAASFDGRDVLMVLPTGFGKSACYQVPSMVLERPVVVVSPLLALLRDQHEKLTKRGIPCVRVDGTVRGPARREALGRIAQGGPLLVMTTPESLGVAELASTLATTGVGLVAVDEAHCLSEWGHDFRPSYLQIGPRLGALGSPPLLALTATATPRVRSGIVVSLGMRDPVVVAASPHRSNLAFEVVRCQGEVRPRALVRLVKRLRRPGIIYCATRGDVDSIYASLVRFGVPAYRYHGGMTAIERDAQQGKYMKPRHRSVMVATSAFGLGIDKRDIRYILHYQAPASLEQYVQEAGRSGRDGRKSNCILLDDPADRKIHELLLSRSRVRPDQLYKLGRALAAWAGEGRDPALDALAVSANLGPRIASALLLKIEEAGLVSREDGTIRVLVPAGSIEEQARSLAGQFETLRTQDARRLDSMAEYAKTTDCRAVFLRTYFGEEGGEVCGLCDVCLGREGRPSSFFAPLAQIKPPPQRGRRRSHSRGRRRRRRGGGGRGGGGGGGGVP